MVVSILSRVSKSNWVAAYLFPSTVILTEVLWVYPWLTLIGRWPLFGQQHTPLSLASLIFLLGGSFIVTKFFIKRRWTLRWTRLSIIACGLAAIIIVLRIEYATGSGLLDMRGFINAARLLVDSFSHPNQVAVALAVGLYLWWRGIGFAHSPLFFEDVYRHFSFGLIVQVILIIAWGTDQQSSWMSATGLYVAGFFFFGLSALALARLKGTQEQARARGISTVFNGRWLSIIIVVIGSIVLVGMGVASIFSIQFLSVLTGVFNFVTGILLKVIFYLSYVSVIVTSFFVSLTFYIITVIINALQGKIPTEPLSSANVTAIPELKQAVSESLSPEALLALKLVLFTIIIASVVFLLVKAILRLRPSQTKEDVEEIHESLWSWHGFLTDLRFFLGLLWQHFRGKIKKMVDEVAEAGRSQSQGTDVSRRLTIREIYQHLLRQASQIGVTRRHQETPYEYSKRLEQSVPEGSAPLNELTDLYVNVRYGELSAEARQTDRANSLWGVILKLLTKDETDQAK